MVNSDSERAKLLLKSIVWVVGLGISSVAFAETAASDYARAEHFLPWNAANFVVNGDIQHHWIGDQDRFWYLRTTDLGGREFVVVNARNGVRRPAFDHARIASSLTLASGVKIDGERLPFADFRFTENERAIQFQYSGKLWTCDREVSRCRDEMVQPSDGALSPDGRWAATLKDHNVSVRCTTDGNSFPLTSDGVDAYGYAESPGDSTHAVGDIRHPGINQPQIVWSPNSRYILSYRLDEREVKDSHLIQSVPEDGSVRPKLYSYRYPLPGDEHVPRAELVVWDLKTRRQTNLATAALNSEVFTPVERRGLWWSVNSRKIYFLRVDRFGRSVALNEADPVTGASREIVRDTAETTVAIDPVHMVDSIRVLSHGGIVWYSQRTGWPHLYYYNRATGKLLNPITGGDWAVRRIVRVDESAERVYFKANGREPGRDPYDQYLYSVKFDGSGLTLLTPEDANHGLGTALPESSFDNALSTGAEKEEFSASGRYFVDSYSKPDLAPMLVLRRADGKLIKQLENADTSKLIAGGYQPVEPFQAVSADGKTRIFGNLHRPGNFNPAKRYPVIDAMYPGVRTQKTFTGATFDYMGAQSLAELGFIVVTVEGRGTDLRSKSFLDYSYGRMEKTSDLDDHIAAMRQLGARYAFIDLDRIGADGISGGGYAAAHAILAHPEFYKVAVSAEGNHDQRGYLSAWGETLIGPLDQTRYEAASNIPLAARLQGKLLLMHGELDDNVSPSLTLKLADALIKANKDFDLLIIPNGNHKTSYMSPYFIRRKWDYFVRYLANSQPPSAYEIIQPGWFARSIGASEQTLPK